MIQKEHMELSDASHAPVLDIGGGFRDVYFNNLLSCICLFGFSVYLLRIKLKNKAVQKDKRNNMNNY